MAANPADDRAAEHGSGSAEEGVGGGGDARRVILSPVHVFNCLNLSEIDAVLLGHFCDDRIISRTASSAGLKILSIVSFVYSDENLHSKTNSSARHNLGKLGAEFCVCAQFGMMALGRMGKHGGASIEKRATGDRLWKLIGE